MQNKGKIVCIFEDDPSFRSSYVSLLEKSGWQVFAYESPSACTTDELKRLQPSVISFDISMPVKSGLAFANELRRLTEFSQTPFIFVTTESDQASKLQAAKVGSKAYFIKFETPIQEIVAWITEHFFSE